MYYYNSQILQYLHGLSRITMIQKKGGGDMFVHNLRSVVLLLESFSREKIPSPFNLFSILKKQNNNKLLLSMGGLIIPTQSNMHCCNF